LSGKSGNMELSSNQNFFGNVPKRGEVKEVMNLAAFE